MKSHQRRGLIIVTLLAVVLPAIGCDGGESSRPPARQVIQLVQPFASRTAVHPTQGQLLGDMDSDGQASVGDAIKILRIVVGLDAYDPRADANESGGADVGDAIKVLRCVVGLDPWPIGYCGPKLSGTVKTWDTQQGVPFFPVRVQETGQYTRTDNNGDYSFMVQPNATYTVVVSKKNYSSFGPASQIVNVGTADVSNVDFEVAAVPLGPGYGRVQGFVMDSSGAPVQGVTVTCTGGMSNTTDENGEYAFDLSAGTYTLTPTLAGHSFSPISRQVIVVTGQIINVPDFTEN